MELVALVTLLMAAQLIYFSLKVGMARGKYDIQAPATSGHEIFDRTYRVHINSVEQLLIVLPAMWVCGYYFNAKLAAALGLAYLIGRFIYGVRYVADPSSRSAGMGIGFLAYIVMILAGLWGVIGRLLA